MLKLLRPFGQPSVWITTVVVDRPQVAQRGMGPAVIVVGVPPRQGGDTVRVVGELLHDQAFLVGAFGDATGTAPRHNEAGLGTYEAAAKVRALRPYDLRQYIAPTF